MSVFMPVISQNKSTFLMRATETLGSLLTQLWHGNAVAEDPATIIPQDVFWCGVACIHNNVASALKKHRRGSGMLRGDDVPAAAPGLCRLC